MTEFWHSVLPALLPAILAAVVTGFITVRLMPKHYYRQRWLERKAQAYIDNVSALAEMDMINDDCFTSVRTKADYDASLEVLRSAPQTHPKAA